MSWYVPGGPDQLATTLTADRFRKQFYRPDIISQLLKSGSLEKAMEAADKARGIKTNGQIYLHHLESYVIEAVQEWSRDEQHPVMSKPMSVRSFALAKAVK